MAVNKAASDREDGGVEAVEPYSMHVSAKYLELTKRKLELTRLPHELELPDERRWAYGTPKSVLEPLVDYWLADYDWRAQERHFNTVLPQFRTSIPLPSDGDPRTSLRIHFVHQPARLGDLTPPRTADVTVIPLLWCHDVPASSFLDVGRVIHALASCPEEAGLLWRGNGVMVEEEEEQAGDIVVINGEAGQLREKSFVEAAKEKKKKGVMDRPVAFHVVAPSVPGTGFSDANAEEGFGAWETAEVFDGLMRRLGYERYVAFGAGWGFAVCRALALRYGEHGCVAVHGANSASFFPPPSLRTTPLAWLKYQVARATRARIPGLSFGYVPADFTSYVPQALSRKTADEEKAIPEPSVHATDNDDKLETGASLSACHPQTAAFALCDSPAGLLADTLDELRPCLVLGGPGIMSSIWTPATLLNWTMMRWLPGPEAGLRWLQSTKLESKPDGQLWRAYSSVPVGISQFGRHNSPGGRKDATSGWAHAWQRVHWMKERNKENAVRPEWERPDDLVEDLRESFGKAWAARFAG